MVKRGSGELVGLVSTDSRLEDGGKGDIATDGVLRPLVLVGPGVETFQVHSVRLVHGRQTATSSRGTTELYCRGDNDRQ